MSCRALSRCPILKVVIALAMLTACAPATHPNLSVWSFADVETITSTEVSPEFDPTRHTRFSVIAVAGTEDFADRTEIQEQQMLFVVRSHLERAGYVYTDSPTDADFVVGISGIQNDYETTYVPPSQYTVPVWVPGQTYTSTSNYTEQASAFGSGGWASGYGSGTATTTTETPGYVSARTYTRSGYTQGNYYPAVGIGGFDTSTGDILFSATSVAVTNIPDVRVSFPFLMNHIATRLPFGTAYCPTVSDDGRSTGIDFIAATMDGNRYFPAVVGKDPAHPPRVVQGDIKEYDLILAADGGSLENLSTCEIKAIWEDAGETMELSLLRGKKIVSAVIQPY